MGRNGALMVLLPVLLFACAQDGNQTDGTDPVSVQESGLQKIGILARGME